MPGNFYAQPMFNETVSAVTATNSVQLGAVRMENGEEYVYVYNAGNSQINPSYGAVMSAVSGFSVTVSSTTGQMAVGFCKHTTLTTGTYGWLLVKGFVSSVVNAAASTAIVAGNPVQMQLDGKLTPPGETGPYVGAAMTATGSAGTFSAFIRCFGV